MELFFPSLLRGWLAPPVCLACKELVHKDKFLCGGCEQDIEELENSHCSRCAEIFPNRSLSPHLCGKCMKHEPPFKKVWGSFVYRGPLPELLHGVKFGKNPLGLKILTQRGFPAFRQACKEFQPDEILPVPLSSWRRFTRGFNQSYLLAHYLLKQQKSFLPIKRWVIRRHSKAQAQQTKNKRSQSLKNAFSVPRPDRVRGKRILIVDDVMTTGATVEALSRCLLKAGAKEVGVYILARTPKN